MAAFVHVAKRLLLFLITTGVAGEDGQISAARAYDIAVPCEGGMACFHIWQIHTWSSEFIAIVSSGGLPTAESEEDKCTLRLQDITAEDVGRHHCLKRTDDFSLHNTAPVINLTPAKSVSLQCVFLSILEKRYCRTELYDKVSLAWLDEAGAEIQADTQRHITRRSSCDRTLTVTYRSPENMTFRCQATVDGEVFTSAELQVRASAVKGKRRGRMLEMEPEYQEETSLSNQDMIGATVGVVACVVLTLAVAVFATRRRRRRRTTTNSQQHNESCSAQSSACFAVDTDNDVIYADIVHPSGPDRVRVHERESTEYACVQYK